MLSGILFVAAASIISCSWCLTICLLVCQGNQAQWMRCGPCLPTGIPFSTSF
ncbi:hypothetical protein BDV18DRAFT_139420 [Aspergillus unguis]